MWDIVVASNGTPNLLMRSLGFVVHEVMSSGQKSFKKCCQLLSGFLANDHLPHVSRQSANDRLVMRQNWELCKDLLAFKLRLRKIPQTLDRIPSDEGCVYSHRVICSPLAPNDVGKITQQVRQREKMGRKGLKEGVVHFGMITGQNNLFAVSQILKSLSQDRNTDKSTTYRKSKELTNSCKKFILIFGYSPPPSNGKFVRPFG